MAYDPVFRSRVKYFMYEFDTFSIYKMPKIYHGHSTVIKQAHGLFIY